MGRICCAAPAKINLALHVIGRRADGYHELETLVAFTPYGDRVTVEAQPFGEQQPGGLRLTGPFAEGLNAESDNLVLRAEQALRSSVGGNPPAVAITLEKNLPIASGLGGGSADAAAALIALKAWWRLPETFDLSPVAATLGADVPMCVASRPLLASGVGERIRPLRDLPAHPVVLVNPGVALSTPAVFAALDRRDNPPIGLAGDAFPDVENLAALRNDLEPAAAALQPLIGEVLALLRAQEGCRLARMSGSGATSFALFDEPAQAEAARRAMIDSRPGWWCVATQLMPGEMTRRLCEHQASDTDQSGSQQ